MHLAYSNQMTKQYKKSIHGVLKLTLPVINLKDKIFIMKILKIQFPTLREPILTEQEPAF